MQAPADFLRSLAPGDLVAATVAGSSKLHLIHVVRHVTNDMVKGDASDALLATLVDGQVLCSARPRYFWRPTDQLESWAADSRCPACFSRWRAGGRPEVKGWAKAEKALPSAVRLPWGWEAVEPSSHPLDLPDSAPDPDPDEQEEKVGSKRREVARWLRGTRYVRVTQDAKDQRFCLRFGDLGDGPTDEEWWVKGGRDTVWKAAGTLMALGGARASKTGYFAGAK